MGTDDARDLSTAIVATGRAAYAELYEALASDEGAHELRTEDPEAADRARQWLPRLPRPAESLSVATVASLAYSARTWDLESFYTLPHSLRDPSRPASASLREWAEEHRDALEAALGRIEPWAAERSM